MLRFSGINAGAVGSEAKIGDRSVERGPDEFWIGLDIVTNVTGSAATSGAQTAATFDPVVAVAKEQVVGIDNVFRTLFHRQIERLAFGRKHYVVKDAHIIAPATGENLAPVQLR